MLQDITYFSIFTSFTLLSTFYGTIIFHVQTGWQKKTSRMHRTHWTQMMIVIMIIIASYTDDEDRTMHGFPNQN